MSARFIDFILFHGLCSFTGVIYFDVQIIPDLANLSLFKLTPVCIWQICIIFWTLSYFFATKRSFSVQFMYIFVVPALKSTISQKYLVSFSGKWDLNPCYVSLFLGPISKNRKLVYVCTYTHKISCVYICNIHVYI